jgi:hypothetical protein
LWLSAVAQFPGQQLLFYYYESIPDQSLIQINTWDYLDEIGVSKADESGITTIARRCVKRRQLRQNIGAEFIKQICKFGMNDSPNCHGQQRPCAGSNSGKALLLLPAGHD